MTWSVVSVIGGPVFQDAPTDWDSRPSYLVRWTGPTLPGGRGRGVASARSRSLRCYSDASKCHECMTRSSRTRAAARTSLKSRRHPYRAVVLGGGGDGTGSVLCYRGGGFAVRGENLLLPPQNPPRPRLTYSLIHLLPSLPVQSRAHDPRKG